MTREELKELIKQVIVDMSNSFDTKSESVANTTANVGGFSAPMGSVVKRKKKTK